MTDPIELPAERGRTATPHPLVELLDRLDHDTEPADTIPELLALTAAGIIHRRLLQQADPIAEVLGTVAEPDWLIVGIRAAATAQRVDQASTDRTGCTIVHLVDRRGSSLTRLTLPDGGPLLFGPDEQHRAGRIPDACRRILTLATPPPPGDMVEFVVDAWLTLVLRRALLEPGLDWPEVVRLNFSNHLAPASIRRLDPETVPPARLAERTIAAARALDWDRYRAACLALGGCPVSELSAESIAWMDTGMFARWAQNALPTSEDLLELLEPVLGPHAFDRLWATVSLCGHPGVVDRAC